jgi:hypothetical protein
MNNIHSNARFEGETFRDYRGRLKVMAKVIKAKLRGTLAHVSAPDASNPLHDPTYHRPEPKPMSKRDRWRAR